MLRRTVTILNTKTFNQYIYLLTIVNAFYNIVNHKLFICILYTYYIKVPHLEIIIFIVFIIIYNSILFIIGTYSNNLAVLLINVVTHKKDQ